MTDVWASHPTLRMCVDSGPRYSAPPQLPSYSRLATAARRETRLRRPLRLAQLVTEGLVALDSGDILVRSTVPLLGPRQLRRLSPSLRAEHETVLAQLTG